MVWNLTKVALDELGTKVISINHHLVPKTDRVVIAANHPLGGLDGMAPY